LVILHLILIFFSNFTAVKTQQCCYAYNNMCVCIETFILVFYLKWYSIKMILLYEQWLLFYYLGIFFEEAKLTHPNWHQRESNMIP
jgi:hypothetical protein